MTESPSLPRPDLPNQRQDLQVQNVGRDLMVYHPGTQWVHVLNGVAANIFRMCDGRHDVEAMEKELRTLFDVTGEQDVRRDILETLAQLREKGLLR